MKNISLLLLMTFSRLAFAEIPPRAEPKDVKIELANNIYEYYITLSFSSEPLVVEYFKDVVSDTRRDNAIGKLQMFRLQFLKAMFAENHELQLLRQGPHQFWLKLTDNVADKMPLIVHLQNITSKTEADGQKVHYLQNDGVELPLEFMNPRLSHNENSAKWKDNRKVIHDALEAGTDLEVFQDEKSQELKLRLHPATAPSANNE